MIEWNGLAGLEALAVPLPEDIGRMVAAGDLEHAARVIDLRVKKDIPQQLRERLFLEKEIIGQLPGQYPYTIEEAQCEMEATFQNYRRAELQHFMDEGSVEWIFLEGEVRLKDDFAANLIKTREELAERVIHTEQIQGKWDNFKMLDQMICKMKQKGTVSCRFRIRSTVTIHPERVRPGKQLQVQLPLPIEYAQVSGFKLLNAKPEKVKLAPAQCEQRTISFDNVCTEEAKYCVEYEFETKMQYWDWKTAMGERETGAERQARTGYQTAGEKETSGYLAEQFPHIRFTPYLRALTAEIIGAETDPLKKAKRIYDYITMHVMYSFVRSYFTIPQQVEFIASNMKGDCGLQALLFITLCRIAGVPARWQSGLYANPLTIGCHDWAQFYIEPDGWLFADCSFGGAAYRAGDLERWDFYFGNLDPYRLPAAREYQKEFWFHKNYMRRDPYDNQMGEAEYEDMGLLQGVDFDTQHEVLYIED